GLMAQTATNPVFSPGGSTYTGSVTVTISNSTAGSKFFCTTDGSTPDISSPQVGPTIVIGSTTTLTCIAAVPGVQQSNMQAQNPISSYWKSPPNCDCATTSACSVTTYNHSGPGCQIDDPGGSGIPPSTSWSTGITSPSLSGNSMEFAGTGQISNQTNFLFTVHTSFGGCDGCTQFLETHDYYWPSASNSSSDEDDMASFDNTSGIRYMAGAQYCHLGCPSGVAGWDFWGNSNVPWTYTGVTAGGTRGVWHHYQRYLYRIPAEESSRPCSASGSWPYMYIKFLAIDGTQYTNGGSPWKACANALPSGWGSVAFMQAQIDIASHSTSLGAQQYWDNTVFLATYPPSAVNSATYTIGAPTSTPQQIMSGHGVLSGNGAVIQ
ncbi:MAG TPA: chitobiase/beta-hexosaminidase C-terminal domain-containing protein, partial [Candidatus Saccharimonadales bacterium]